MDNVEYRSVHAGCGDGPKGIVGVWRSGGDISTDFEPPQGQVKLLDFLVALNGGNMSATGRRLKD